MDTHRSIARRGPFYKAGYAASQFYSSLPGWSANDFPMAPSGFYTLFSLEGRYTGGCYTLSPEMQALGEVRS